MKRTIIPAAVLAAFATAASANAPSFYDVDANSDSKVTWDELSAAVPSASLFDFNAIDQNGDRSISAVEMENNIDALDLDRTDEIIEDPVLDVVTVTTDEVTPFSVIDTDNNMKVSWEELSYAAPKASLFDFTEVDQNGDGSLTEAELANGIDKLELSSSDESYETGEATTEMQPKVETNTDS